MSSDNGNGTIDLSRYRKQLIEVDLGDGLKVTLVADLPLSLLLRAERSLGQLQTVSETSFSEEDAATLEGIIWSVTEEAMTHAMPPLERPIREILNLPGALEFVGFLVGKWQASMTHLKPPSASPRSTAAPSRSRRSSRARSSTGRPSA